MMVVFFDKIYEIFDEFFECLVCNQQLLLKEELYFDKVIDLVVGFYYIENFMVFIVKQVWEIFFVVEEEGGFYVVLKVGIVQVVVNESNKVCYKVVVQCCEVLLGINQFFNFNEKVGDKKLVEVICCCGGYDICEKDVVILNFDCVVS